MRSLFFAVAVTVLALTGQAQAADNNCDLSGLGASEWLHPDPTTLAEVRNGSSANNCDFHVFSWQWFTYLMNPFDGDTRNFENRAVHPVVDLDTCASVTGGNSLALAHNGVVSSMAKMIDMPDVPDQASGNALFDKNGNLVFYNRNFTVNECGIYASGMFPDPGADNPGFPTGKDQVVELKTAWQILNPSIDHSNYYTQVVALEGEGELLLGLVGMHIVVNTALHPEFVWATFEHVGNSPNCTVNEGTGFTRPQPADGWAFVGPTCNACVASNYSSGTNLETVCASQCSWNPSNNDAPAASYDVNGNAILKGTPSDICLVEYLGTPSDQSSGDQNIANIEYLNTLLVGPGGVISSLGASDEMKVLENYFLAGAVWTDMDKLQKGADFNTAMAGSTALANASMESFSQPHSASSSFFDTGCFSCHGGANETNTAAASHLLTSAAGGAPGLIERCNVKAGPIGGQSQAEAICPTVCTGNGNAWNGNWLTIPGSSMSVCGCNSCVAN